MFCTLGESRDPEVYPRPDGEIYVCGMADKSPLPAHPSGVVHDPGSTAAMRAQLGRVSSALTGDGECAVMSFHPRLRVFRL